MLSDICLYSVACNTGNIFTLLYKRKRPAVRLHLTSGGMSDETHYIATETHAILECLGWTAALEEHSSSAANMSVLRMLCHRKRKACYGAYMLLVVWYAPNLHPVVLEVNQSLGKVAGFQTHLYKTHESSWWYGRTGMVEINSSFHFRPWIKWFANVFLT